MDRSIARLAVLTAAVTGAVRLAAQSTAPQSHGDLVGLWGTEMLIGPAVRGELTLTHDATRWTARIGGFSADGPLTADSIHVVLPGGQGEFRGQLDTRERLIHGFWVQPVGQILGAAYATPVTLTPLAPRAWRGTTHPLDETWSLYLQVQRAPDGSLTAAFRNPDRNWTGGASSFRLQPDRDTLRFLDPDSGRQRTATRYDSVARQIIMDFGRPVVLTSRTRDQAVGFFPRSPAAAPYVYDAPVPRHDGWRTARASTVGLSEVSLGALVQRIASTDPTAKDAPLIQSVLVARHGALVLEEYFYGFDASRRHDLRSAAKTLTSVMLGVTHDRGAPITVEAPAYPYFPWGKALTDADPRKATITIGDLLTHSSGLACDDNDDDSPGNEDRMQDQREQPDWARYTLALPVVHPRGTVYAYCSGGINAAAAAIRAATGEWLPAFFDRWIARPLQISDYAINLTPLGEAYGGGGWRMRPRDVLKFGQLYLNGGVWHGQRIVSAAWVARSTAHQIDASNGSSDGYAWHRYTLQVGGQAYQEYEASGNGGQLVIVVPALDLVVGFTAGNYNQYRTVWRKFRDEWLGEYIISAVSDRPR
jgi:CubicO group peptidase (beta-lactamase class C family)